MTATFRKKLQSQNPSWDLNDQYTLALALALHWKAKYDQAIEATKGE